MHCRPSLGHSQLIQSVNGTFGIFRAVGSGELGGSWPPNNFQNLESDEAFRKCNTVKPRE